MCGNFADDVCSGEAVLDDLDEMREEERRVGDIFNNTNICLFEILKVEGLGMNSKMWISKETS